MDDDRDDNDDAAEDDDSAGTSEEEMNRLASTVDNKAEAREEVPPNIVDQLMLMIKLGLLVFPIFFCYRIPLKSPTC